LGEVIAKHSANFSGNRRLVGFGKNHRGAVGQIFPPIPLAVMVFDHQLLDGDAQAVGDLETGASPAEVEASRTFAGGDRRSRPRRPGGNPAAGELWVVDPPQRSWGDGPTPQAEINAPRRQYRIEDLVVGNVHPRGGPPAGIAGVAPPGNRLARRLIEK